MEIKIEAQFENICDWILEYVAEKTYIDFKVKKLENGDLVIIFAI